LRGDAAVPCLFIAGSNDTEILELNEGVLARSPCEKRLAVVEGAGHLFEGADLAAE
jgi:putative phosphoribosyl transferase